jgi:hypothetical protein
MHFAGKWIAAVAAVVTLTGSTFAPRSAETLMVTINGYGKVRGNVVCSWEAVVSGGSGVYTLAWTGGTSGLQQGDKYFATTPSSGSFNITVTATDSFTGETDTATKVAWIVSTAGPCLV